MLFRYLAQKNIVFNRNLEKMKNKIAFVVETDNWYKPQGRERTNVYQKG